MAYEKQRDDNKKTTKQPKENRDPISGEPGSHPIGTGVGAATGGVAAGAATGAAIGAAIGVAAGAIAGGLAGKAVAENINPTLEHEYWRGKYSKQPYVKSGEAYEQYGSAYQTGWESQAQHQDKSFEDVDADLQREWDTRRGESKLDWQRAKPAARDAWERARRRAAEGEAFED